ncbi:porin [Stappia indica]|uniref:Porin n=1 Tax=Stappia indica TaxID=538381 RepID=A0A857CCG7_9HYPH|nr:porin [Stappia indica]QGZ36152.1 porin [Stappia indica]
MNIKSILLGASAAALAATGAQAADLPVAPEPVDYVRVCDAFGTGFFYIPGTETCLKIGGSVRAELRINDLLDNGGSAWGGATRNTLPLADSTTMRARGYFNFDSRTNTEYGLLRTYVSVWITADNSAPVTTELDEAFIQLGGFVAGRTGSYFDFYTGDNWGSVLDQGFSDYGETNLFAYTAQFGNGFSASLSAEVANKRGTIAGPVVGTDYYSGHKVPDFVANLRVDQGWGSAQIMGALHHVYGRSVGGLTGGKSKLGWAIGAGATMNLDMIAPGDSFSLQATYSQGAIGYVSSAWAGAFSDAAYNGAGQLKMSTAWGIGGGFTHFWTPAISTSITAAYNSLDQAASAGLADIRDLNVQGNVVWRPVSGLQIGTELEYRNRDIKGVAGNDDALVGVFRVQRTF